MVCNTKYSLSIKRIPFVAFYIGEGSYYLSQRIKRDPGGRYQKGVQRLVSARKQGTQLKKQWTQLRTKFLKMVTNFMTHKRFLKFVTNVLKHRSFSYDKFRVFFLFYKR
jgi:hypothetical protein